MKKTILTHCVTVGGGATGGGWATEGGWWAAVAEGTTVLAFSLGLKESVCGAAGTKVVDDEDLPLLLEKLAVCNGSEMWYCCYIKSRHSENSNSSTLKKIWSIFFHDLKKTDLEEYLICRNFLT